MHVHVINSRSQAFENVVKFPSLCHERYNEIVFVIIIEVPRLSLKAAFNSQKELGPRITTKPDILL